MIELITYLLRTSRTIRVSGFFVLVALAAGLLSGAGYAALIALLNSALSGRRGTEDLWAFVGLCLAVLLTRLASQGLFDFVALKTVSDVRLQLCRRILATPLHKLEEIGSQRLAGALSDDVIALRTALTQLPRVFMNLAISLACLAYLGWLSWKVLPFFLGFMAIGTVIHQILLAKANFFFRRLREQRDVQLAQLRALIEGAKELKLQRWRRLDLVRSGLIPTSEAIRRFTSSGNAFFAGASTWGNILFFVAVVLLLAGPGRQGLEQQVISGYTLTLLYMLLPLELFFLSLPTLGRAATAVRKLEHLGLQLAASPEPVAGGSLPAASWRSLDLVDVTYTYRGDEGGGEGFRLGPLQLSLHPGELVFLIGGNGSGKTTLAKVLTGLYAPASGEILVDGQSVTEENRDDYRQMFSAVFEDFHLFQSPVARESLSGEAARGYLTRFRLEGVEADSLPALDLSEGQRKRLALLNAYLEDRPVYFFDEWTVGQDPEFRKVFYLGILPELRDRGKTVIITSHDDPYYELANRLIKLADGRIAWERQGAHLSETYA